ncbi:MAG: hypothetical protein RM368_28000 [Nostoc sp. DedSLP03]|uniref:hypothetical protein n=1 Tax=Nostoc sp. DedSLP03 TaxID=3075400 RepID=UPI002AD1FD33|nr:hypothetical protein [Nostoc sp. DedSLP03]MDZ7968751.1 hypothetical protein [Nostoc sp. DedSLP03]
MLENYYRYMTIQELTIKQKIAITLDPNSGASVVPIFNYVPYSKTGYRLIDEYLEVENLRATSWIYSLPPVPFPVFELEDSESKQLLTAINLEWKSPRIQLDIVVGIDGTLNWQRIAAYSLLNSDPYPYREYSLGSHSLGNNSMLGLQIRAVGHGLLQNSAKGQDKVTACANLVRHVIIEKLTDTSVKIVNNITAIASTIVNSNANRKGITFFNSSNKNVFLDTVKGVSITSHLVKLEPGDYYEAPSPLYTGAYYGIVESGNTAIDIREFT